MIYLKSLLNVIDNSGAQIVECIKVLRHNPKNFARVGDQITVVVQKARLAEGNQTNKVKRRDICRAVIVRQKAPFKRKDGTVLRFDDNACVLINKNGDPIGSRVSGVVAKEIKDLQYSKIATLAPKVF